MKETIKVSTFSGLFDETHLAMQYDISDRKFCLKHVFINALLKFEKGNYCVDIWQRHTLDDCWTNYGLREWGAPYGGIRFCKKCKLIDCIHRWDSKTLYEAPDQPFVVEIKEVGFCGVCLKRVEINGYRSWKPLDVVYELIKKIAPEYGFEYDSDKLSGSWWFLEFPQQASIFYERSPESSEAYIRENLENRKNGIYPK